MLDVLDTLDRHNFDKVENNNSLDSLYNKIFAVSQAKDGTEVSALALCIIIRSVNKPGGFCSHFCKRPQLP